MNILEVRAGMREFPVTVNIEDDTEALEVYTVLSNAAITGEATRVNIDGVLFAFAAGDIKAVSLSTSEVVNRITAKQEERRKAEEKRYRESGLYGSGIGLAAQVGNRII